jgi:Family of unknown function (DUF6516)
MLFMASAILLLDEKQVLADGAIVQMRLWQVPSPVRGSRHFIKYSLFYGRPGVRLLAYDNEAGKGDHVHRGEIETPYCFVSVEKLIADFLKEVRAMRGS